MDSPRPGMASVAQRTVLMSFITIVFMSSMTSNKPSMMLSPKAAGLTCCGGCSLEHRELQEGTHPLGPGRCPLSLLWRCQTACAWEHRLLSSCFPKAEVEACLDFLESRGMCAGTAESCG